jgi:hypothetical protein
MQATEVAFVTVAEGFSPTATTAVNFLSCALVDFAKIVDLEGFHV